MPIDSPPIVIEQLAPSAALPRSPRLAPDRPGLAIEIVPATHHERPTLAVLGTVTLTKRQSQLYGPDADQVLRLVAFDPRSGRVFHADLAGSHAPALGPVTIFNPPEPPRTPTGALLPTTFGFNFNLDLVSRLNLPAEAARYTVVAWIEDVVSETRVAEVPEDKLRFPAKPFLAEPSVASPINVRKTSLSPARQSGVIAIRLASPAEDPEHRLGQIFVSLGPGVLPAVAPGIQAAPKYVAILAQTALDRRVAARTVRLPGAVFDETGCGEFDFEVADLFPADLKRQPVFVILVAGQQVSKSATVIPPGWSQ